MNIKFRNYVTDLAFHLTLGKTHISVLYGVKNGGYIAATLWVPAVKSLEQKGLITTLPIMNADGEWNGNHLKPFRERYKLTEEGKLVYKLLELAGLIENKVPIQKVA